MGDHQLHIAEWKEMQRKLADLTKQRTETLRAIRSQIDSLIGEAAQLGARYRLTEVEPKPKERKCRRCGSLEHDIRTCAGRQLGGEVVAETPNEPERQQ